MVKAKAAVRASVIDLPSPVRPKVAAETGSASAEFNVAAHGLRGVAAMMVFAGHLLGGTAKHIYDADPSYFRTVEPMWHFGTAGVVLFFVISGFVILPSVVRYSPGQFALRRLVRLYPLFLVLTLLFVAMNAATNLYPNLNNITSIVAGLTFLNIFVGTEQLTPNAWSLSFEVMFYALTCLGVYFIIHRPNRIGLAIAAAICLVFLIIFPIACFFLGGIIIRILYDRGIGLPVSLARPLELIAALCFVRYASMSWFAYVPADFANPIALKIVASSICYFFLAVPRTSLTSMCLRSTQALYLGTVSYSLYLVHPYTYYLCRRLFDRLGWFTDDQYVSLLLFFGATIPITLIATHIIHRTIEMKPYEWVFRQGIYRSAGSAASAPEHAAK